MSTREVSNSEDILDSRDVIKRIEELQSERDDLEFMDDQEKPLAERQEEWDESEEGEELKALLALQDEAEGYAPDWRHGATLLRDSYFDESWAEQELQDLGYLPKDLPGIISNNIDWRGVLEDLKQDYTEVDYDGVTYWVR
jgi:hypothetical protein